MEFKQILNYMTHVYKNDNRNYVINTVPNAVINVNYIK